MCDSFKLWTEMTFSPSSDQCISEHRSPHILAIWYGKAQITYGKDLWCYSPRRDLARPLAGTWHCYNFNRAIKIVRTKNSVVSRPVQWCRNEMRWLTHKTSYPFMMIIYIVILIIWRSSRKIFSKTLTHFRCYRSCFAHDSVWLGLLTTWKTIDTARFHQRSVSNQRWSHKVMICRTSSVVNVSSMKVENVIQKAPSSFLLMPELSNR